jgi:hypothetical protein
MKKFCTACGSVAYPVLVKKGSTGTAFLLWITFLLPGIIYSIWRANSEHEACPACGSPQVIPVDSPMAQKLMGDDYRKMKEAEAQAVAAEHERQRLENEELRRIQAVELAKPWIKRRSTKDVAVATVFIGALMGAFLLAIIYGKPPSSVVQPSVAQPTVAERCKATGVSEDGVTCLPAHTGSHKSGNTRVRNPIGGKEAHSYHTKESCQSHGFFWAEEETDTQQSGCWLKQPQQTE